MRKCTTKAGMRQREKCYNKSYCSFNIDRYLCNYYIDIYECIYRYYICGLRKLEKCIGYNI